VPVAQPDGGEGRHRTRSWPRRLLIAANLFVALCVLAAGSGYAYLRWRFNQIDEIPFKPGVLTEDPGDAMNVLLVGSDTRDTLTDAADVRRNAFDQEGHRITGQRSDTIMVMHVDPRGGKAAILSIPRDLWVTIADSDRHQRINTAFETGPERLIRTITSELGIEVHHYVQVDFVGFRNLVSAVGGVPIYVPSPARDRYSDLRIDNPGCITLDGNQALAWVRSRHYQYYESGRWRSDPTSDFGRIQRQQDFIRRLMKRSISRGIRNPLTANRMIGIAVKNVTKDDDLSPGDLRRLGNAFRSLDPNKVDMLTLPVKPVRIGGADVLTLRQPDAQVVVDRFNGVSPPETGGAPAPGVVPNEVRVRILNGTGVSGQAARVASALTGYGFNNAGTGDADGFTYRKSVIRYGKGQRDKADLLRGYLNAGAQLTEDRTLQGVDLVLVTGNDFAGLAKPPAPATTSTTVTPPTSLPPATGAKPEPQC
jgi:polyisoprenyl-teichoic acid--peptidoglycan teichoic acid transferase